MTTLPLATFLEEIKSLGDLSLISDLLIETAQRFQPVPEHIATRPFSEHSRVPGCESEVYVFYERLEAGRLKFYFAVENPQGISAKALAVVLDEGLSGAPVEQVAATNPEVVYDIFGRGLSMGKGQGLMGMINMCKHIAQSESRGGYDRSL